MRINIVCLVCDQVINNINKFMPCTNKWW